MQLMFGSAGIRTHDNQFMNSTLHVPEMLSSYHHSILDYQCTLKEMYCYTFLEVWGDLKCWTLRPTDALTIDIFGSSTT